MQNLQGKVVLVTGGGQGLGEAVCRNLAANGMHVVVADMRFETAEKVAQSIRQNDQVALALPLDVRDENQAKLIINQVVDKFGRLDVLINNAGTDVTVGLEELTIPDWDRVLAVNLRGPF